MGDGLSAYRDALDYLFVRTTGQWRFGLERTRALLAELGDPHRALRIIHVGGTNGKGSVCATLEAVLRGRGFRVAKYTSPHLVDFRERMTVDGVPLPELDVVAFIEQWTPAIERLGATFFEATTAMAFALFARANPDIAIIEVGLGGRLDSTNVVDPVMSVVTNIGIDHTEYLGDTREAIAREKAGIFKRGVPAIIGEPDDRICALLAGLARDAGAAPVDAVHAAVDLRDVAVSGRGTTFTMNDARGRADVATPLIGTHQAANTVVALRALQLLAPPFATTVRDAVPFLSRVSLAGRFDRRSKYVFDVAHNVEGARVLATTLNCVAPPRPRAAVVSILRDKDWKAMLAALAPEVDRLVLTLAPTSPASRAWDPAEALQFATGQGWPAECVPEFDAALLRGASIGETVVVTGSFHTVGDAMERLHLSPLGG